MIGWLGIILLFAVFAALGRLVEASFGRRNFVGVEPYMLRKATGYDVQKSTLGKWLLDHTVLAWGMVFLLVLALQRLGAPDLVIAAVVSITIALGSCLVIGKDVFSLKQAPRTKSKRSDPFAIDWCKGYESWATIAMYFVGSWAMSGVVRALDR
jgi:hypothetical protein